MRHRIKKAYSVQKDAGQSLGSDSKLHTDEQQLNQKSHLLHSDKSTSEYTHRRCSLNTSVQGSTQFRLLEACAHTSSFGRSGPLGQVLGRAKEVFAASKRKTTSSSEKVFTGAACAYFYSNKLSGSNSMRNRLSNIPLLLSSLVLLLVLGGLVFPTIPSGAYAESSEAVDGGSEDANTSMALSEGENPSLSLSLADTANSGIMSSSGDNTTIQGQVTSSDNVGHISVDFNVKASNIDKYDIYVQSSSENLVGEATGEKISSINTDTSYTNMKNSTGWGYAVEKGSKYNPEVATYKPIQTTVNTPVDSGSATNTSIDQTYTLAFAANLSGVSADHYKTNIILSVAAGANQVATLYSVTYNTNGSTAGVTPPTQTAESDASTYSFTAPDGNDLAKTGYALAGWSTDPNSIIPQYDLGATITLDSGAPNKKLYAVWTSWDILTTMQDMTSTACSNAEENSSKQLVDIRDGKTYWVAKLKDGNCWMTQNLDLEIPASGLKAIDTDIDKDWNSSTNPTYPPYGTANSTSGWYNNSGNVASYDPGMYVRTSTAFGKTCDTSNGLGDSVCDGQGWENVEGADVSTYDTHYLVGNYYTWVAATAGTGGDKIDEDAGGSICPKGWRLPTSPGNDTNPPSFGGLVNGGGSGISRTSAMNSPYYFVAGGLIYNDTLNFAGAQGLYWSSKPVSAQKSYIFIFHSTSINSSWSIERTDGLLVRCVAR